MSIDLEYAIKKDIRNNPVVRETDVRHGREMRRTVVLVVVTVLMLLFSVWQRSNKVAAGIRVEKLRRDLRVAETANRQLRLNVQTLLAAPRIEARARALGMTHPTLQETQIVERARDVSPSGAIVARAR
jgi:cell division protein FtsL